MASDVEKAGLLADIDTMHDVYMSRAQREAYDRIKAAALTQPAASGELTPSLDRAVEAACLRLRELSDSDAEYKRDLGVFTLGWNAALPHLSPGVDALTLKVVRIAENMRLTDWLNAGGTSAEQDELARRLALIDNKQESSDAR